MAIFTFYRQKGSTYESKPIYTENFRGKTDAKSKARELSKTHNCRIRFQSSPRDKHYVHFSDRLNSAELEKKYRNK